MTEHKDIETKVVALVAKQFELEPARVLSVNDFTELGADYLAMIELVMRLEDLFDLEINDEDAQQITSVRTTVSYIATKKAA